jgi:membrane-associated phospholipid phosphatase
VRPARPLPLLALAVACAAGVAATYLLLVRTRHGQRLDQGAFDGRALATPGAHDAAQQLLTTISVGTLALATAVLMAQALLRGRVGLAVVAGTVIGGSVLSTEVLKRLLPRPDLVIDGRIWANSFPSGHATVAFAVGVAATLVAPRRVRRAVALVAVVYGAAVGIAVLAAGWHRPSDVGGAYFVVVCWAALVALVDSRAERHKVDASRWPRPAIARHYYVIGGALLALGYVGTIGIVAAGQAGAVDWSAVDAAFAGACVTIAGLAALLMAALLAAMRAALPQRRTSGARSGFAPERRSSRSLAER